MTNDEGLNIQSVAIVGAGAAGLTALFELIHTKKDGSTTIVYDQQGNVKRSNLVNKDPAFKKIVCFEQASTVGGIWAPSFEDPEEVPQELLNTECYNDPWVLRPKTPLPKDIKSNEFSLNAPLVTTEKSLDLTWSKSGIYRHLFSNVPGRYLRNSFIPYYRNRTINKRLHPLIKNVEITNNLLTFTSEYGLTDYIKLNSEIADIRKTNDGSKWKLTVKQYCFTSKTAKWYTEDFDAVIISTGHYPIPYLPKIKGLSTWNAERRSSIVHSKFFRDPALFKNKNVLLVGTGLSGVDILQYVFPVAKSVTVSRSPNKEEIYPWLTRAAMSEGIEVKPRIKEVNCSEHRKVIFDDGTSIESVDYIIFATGYHWHYPFFNNDSYVSVLPAGNKSAPDGSSMVDGLFLNTFAVNDPTLAFVGVTVTPLKWPSFEITAAAIAGVWSNKAKLPHKLEQIENNRRLLGKTGKNLFFHYYPVDRFSDYVKELAPYLPKGRNSANIYDKDHLDDVRESMVVAEKLFYQYKNGIIKIDDDVWSIDEKNLNCNN